MRPPVVGEGGPKARSDAAETAYQVTISKYSDRGEAYDQLDTRVFCAATYQSWVFREARVQRLASFQSQTAEQVLKTLDQERSTFDAYYEFWLGVHVNEIGRAACRGKVEISGVAVSLKKKKKSDPQAQV